MAIHIEVCLVPVHSFAHMICQPAERKNIGRAIQRNPVIKLEAFAGQDFFVNCLKPPIVSLKGMRSHYLDDTSGWRSLASGLS
jgi:hypothetical protein